MVRANMGLTFLPEMALLQEMDGGGLHPLNFLSEELHRSIWLSWNGDADFPARTAFVEALQDVVRSHEQANAR